MRKEPIGHMACPECDFPDAEVREDKNGLAYRYCTDCNAQYFSRTAERDKRLRAKMRATAAPAAPQDDAPAEDVKTDMPEPQAPAAPPKPARKGFSLEDLK
jgi:hypothetical protein